MRDNGILSVFSRTEDGKLMMLHENEFKDFEIIKKEEGIFVIESIGLLFCKSNGIRVLKLGYN